MFRKGKKEQGSFDGRYSGLLLVQDYFGSDPYIDRKEVSILLLCPQTRMMCQSTVQTHLTL